MLPFDPRRFQLCGPVHAARVALRLTEETSRDHVVIRTRERLQPLRVCRNGETDGAQPLLTVVML